jgi:hypothetical protein
VPFDAFPLIKSLGPTKKSVPKQLDENFDVQLVPSKRHKGKGRAGGIKRKRSTASNSIVTAVLQIA